MTETASLDSPNALVVYLLAQHAMLIWADLDFQNDSTGYCILLYM